MRASAVRRGFTLLELSVSISLVVIASGLLASGLIASANHRDVARESALVSLAVADVFERMRNEPFEDVLALYDPDPLNDPGGPGTAPGNAFAIEGLLSLDDDPDGFVAEIQFPLVNTGGPIAEHWELREDADFALLGCPRDLNGDKVIDALDHREDYRVLPVQIEVRWSGRRGARMLRMQTLFAEWVD